MYRDTRQRSRETERARPEPGQRNCWIVSRLASETVRQLQRRTSVTTETENRVRPRYPDAGKGGIIQKYYSQSTALATTNWNVSRNRRNLPSATLLLDHGSNKQD